MKFDVTKKIKHQNKHKMKSTFCFLILFLAVTLTVDAQTIIFSDDFETGTFGASWTATPGTPNGVVSINTGIGNPGRGVRMGKTSAGGFVTNTLDLTLNLSANSGLDVAMMYLSQFAFPGNGPAWPRYVLKTCQLAS